VAAVATVVMLVAAPAKAGLGIACPDSTSQPFRAWSDVANYAFVPDGGFEAGAAGWSLNGGAETVTGNEPFFIHSKTDRTSLSLPVGSSATSPPMCISLLSSKMRFLLSGSAGATVKVQIVYRGLVSTVLGVLDGGTFSAAGAWQPSQQIGMLGGVLPLLTQSVQFRFVAVNGATQIDDVYLDPWKGW
jgi:hypothetical protein